MRTGPALFEMPGAKCVHWFEGLALLVRFELGDTPKFGSRFLRSESLARAEQRVGLLGRIWRRLAPILGRRPQSDNASVNVAPLGGGWVAMTETPNRVRFDPKTLESLGPLVHTDDVVGQLTTAHPHYDEARARHYNYLTSFGKESVYHLHSMPDGSRERVPLTSLKATRPAYMHSFAATKDHLILTEPPLFLQPLRLKLGGGTLFDYMTWDPHEGTRVRAVKKSGGAPAGEWRLEPFFFFHHVAAREVVGGFEIDVVAFENADVLFELTLEKLRSEHPPSGMGLLRRYVLKTGGGVERIDLSEQPLELPRVDPRLGEKAPRFVYGVGNGSPESFVDRLVKVDVEGPTKHWQDGLTYPGEPVFVPRPDGEAEDDGVVLSVVLDAAKDCSFLLVLDAHTFVERARVWAPTRIPMGFHGVFLPS